MIKEKRNLSEEDWALVDILYSPKDFCEFFVPEPPRKFYDWDGSSHLKLRLYQLGLLSYEYNLVEDPELSKQEIFDDRKSLGNLVARGGRVYGKSMVVIDLDNLQDAVIHDGEEHLLIAYDDKHLSPRFEALADTIERHKFFSLFKAVSKKDSVNRSKKIIELENGHTTYGRIEGQKAPGDGWLGLHPHRKTIEEAQMITTTAFKKQIDTKAEPGCVERLSGVPDGRRDTPFHDYINNKNKRRIWYTSEVNPFWNEEKQKEKREEYEGINTHGYVTNVLGEEGDIAFGAWDVEDIKANMSSNHVKRFETSANHYDMFLTNPKRVLNIVPDEQSDFIIIASDIGKSPSECGIFSYKRGKWFLIYRITLRGLVHFQQAKIFHYILATMGANYLALDTSEGLGESIADHLINEKEPEFKGYEYPKRLIKCNFKEHVITGYKKDEKGNIIFEDKKPIEIKAHADEYAWIRGMEFFKEQRFFLQDDTDLVSQFAAEEAVKGANKITFQSKIPNHIVSMFKVFLLAEWRLNKDIKKPTKLSKSDFLGCWLK